MSVGKYRFYSQMSEGSKCTCFAIRHAGRQCFFKEAEFTGLTVLSSSPPLPPLPLPLPNPRLISHMESESFTNDEELSVVMLRNFTGMLEESPHLNDSVGKCHMTQKLCHMTNLTNNTTP